MSLFEDEFHFVKIETDEMQGGNRVLEELMKGREGGLPWIAILDGEGQELVSSNDSKGNNIGCPVADHEVEHFVEMIKVSSGTDEERLNAIMTEMKAYAETLKN
jgi:hypothetical protein